MKSWWVGLSLRERQWVGLAGAVTAVFLLYLLAWLPFQRATQQRRVDVETQRELLAWMQAAGKELNALRADGSGQAVIASGSPLSAAEELAQSMELRSHITRLESESSGSVRVSFEKAPFDRLLRWSERMASERGIRIDRVSMDPTGEPNRVNAVFTLSRAS